VTPRASGRSDRIVLATMNPGKIREITAAYAALPVQFLSLADFPEIGELAEQGASYAENAAGKAFAVARATGLVALADDSGLEIDALSGNPGIHSRRFLGMGATDADRNARILTLLRDVPDALRTARYRAVVAVALPDGSVRTFEGTCEGRIGRAPRGRGGFGYDPIFLPDETGRTMAELPVDVKNRVSHRGRGLRAAEPYVAAVLGQRQDRAADGANNRR